MNNATPQSTLVSVVMPSLNQVAFIEGSIRSVLSQVNVELELIIMDGGSTDGTQAVLSRLSREAKGRMRWYSGADNGPAQAVNRAMVMARGDVIGWLNADDIYMPGAVERAVVALAAQPEWLMLYGNAHHIDACGQFIGDYPTRRPETPVQRFADGCFICQPTVFLRKELIHNVGMLDEGLSSAFDLDWWLRIFSQYPTAIGFIDTIQACSRLHDACITVSRRETSIREGMQVLAKYLGTCPLHWFKTYMNEVLETYPHGQQIKDIKAHLNKFGRSISGYLSDIDRQELRDVLKNDARIRLALADVCLEIYPDAWLPVRSSLRVRRDKHAWRRIEIHALHVAKGDEPLQIKIYSPDGKDLLHCVEARGTFKLDVPLPPASVFPSYWTFAIEVEGGFVPRLCDEESTDDRELACQINKIRLLKN